MSNLDANTTSYCSVSASPAMSITSSVGGAFIQPRYVSTAAAAKFMGVSASWLAHARLEGRGPRWVKPDGLSRVLYDLADCVAWMESQKRDARFLGLSNLSL